MAVIMAGMWWWAGRTCIYSAAAMTGGTTCMLIATADRQAGERRIQAGADMRAAVAGMAEAESGEWRA